MDSGRKTRKRSLRESGDAANQNSNDLLGDPENSAENHGPQSNDVVMTLTEIKKALAQIVTMQQAPDPSRNSNSKWPIIEGMLRDIQESIEYLIEMKNDVDEIKTTLSEINSKVSAIMEKQENSPMDVHHIMTSIPYDSLSGAEKLDEYLNQSIIFTQVKEEFSRIGGRPEKMAGIILNKLIAKNVQGQLTWNESGIPIHKFKNVVRLIHTVCKANSVTYTETDGNESIKIALKNARSKN